jgi:hypothetical protein
MMDLPVTLLRWVRYVSCSTESVGKCWSKKLKVSVKAINKINGIGFKIIDMVAGWCHFYCFVDMKVYYYDS